MSKNKSFFLKVLLRRNIKEIVIELLQLLGGYPLYFISFFIPRNKNKWVLGNKGLFTDNAKYLFLYIFENTEIECYWITSSKTLAEKMNINGLPVYYKYSLKGLYHCLTASVYIYSMSPNSINFFTSGGSKLVNLWHGVGIKSHKENWGGLLSNTDIISKICMPYKSINPTLFLVTSDLMEEYFSESFNLKENMILKGMYPRCLFLMQSQADIQEFINKYDLDKISVLISTLKKYQRIYLYMPTWRSNLKGDYLNVAIPDFEKLNKLLCENNAIFLIKQHPSITVDIDSKYESILFLNKEIDIYPILPFVDFLITDYSSIYYDFLLMNGKSILLYPFDLDNYKRNDCALFYDYDLYTPGRRVYSFDQLLSVIENNEVCFVDNRDQILNKFWGNYKSATYLDIIQSINNCINK